MRPSHHVDRRFTAASRAVETVRGMKDPMSGGGAIDANMILCLGVLVLTAGTRRRSSTRRPSSDGPRRVGLDRSGRDGDVDGGRDRDLDGEAVGATAIRFRRCGRATW